MAPILGIYASQISGHLGIDSDFESIATVSVGSGGLANVTFNSIPQTYTHLQIRGIAQCSNSGTGDGDTMMMFNGDTPTISNSNYNQHRMFGNGSTASYDYYNGYIVGMRLPNSGSTNIYGSVVTDILEYTNTSKYKVIKSYSALDKSGSGQIWLNSGVFLGSTNAITSITIGGPFSQYSHFALYGVK